MNKTRRRVLAGAAVTALTVSMLGGPVMAGDEPSEALAAAAAVEQQEAEVQPQAVPAAVVAGAKGFAYAYRATPAFRQAVNQQVGNVLRQAGGIGQFFGFAHVPDDVVAAEEALLDR